MRLVGFEVHRSRSAGRCTIGVRLKNHFLIATLMEDRLGPSTADVRATDQEANHP